MAGTISAGSWDALKAALGRSDTTAVTIPEDTVITVPANESVKPVKDGVLLYVRGKIAYGSDNLSGILANRDYPVYYKWVANENAWDPRGADVITAEDLTEALAQSVERIVVTEAEITVDDFIIPDGVYVVLDGTKLTVNRTLTIPSRYSLEGELVETSAHRDSTIVVGPEAVVNSKDYPFEAGKTYEYEGGRADSSMWVEQ
jgi:hypothetical protein